MTENNKTFAKIGKNQKIEDLVNLVVDISHAYFTDEVKCSKMLKKYQLLREDYEKNLGIDTTPYNNVLKRIIGNSSSFNLYLK